MNELPAAFGPTCRLVRGPHVGKLKAQISSNQVGLLAYVKSNHPKVLEDIAAQGQLSPELDGQIKDIMTKYTAEYSA